MTASLWGTPSLAQEAWDLRKCIDYAIEHNLSIKQQEANMEQREVELNTAKWRRLPNLNANIGQSFNFGRGLQADNTYADTNTKSSNFSVSTNIPLFTGLEIPNTIALSKLNLKAAMEECQDVIDGAYEEACGPDSFGFDWHANNAAWNIYLCCF